MKKLKKGLIHIYTGEGKGKTTAAMGLAFRAMGCGMRVCFLQFFKDKLFPCGEAAAAKRLGKAFKFKRFDVPHPMFCKTGRNALKGRLEKALSEASRIIRSGKFDLVVLDEIIIGVSQGFLTEGEMIKLIKSKPVAVELVLTGRGATAKLIACADYVTYMREEKHPFRSGVKARRGIEF